MKPYGDVERVQMSEPRELPPASMKDLGIGAAKKLLTLPGSKVKKGKSKPHCQ